MMKLEDVQTLENIADYAEGLANDIENGVEGGIPNGQLIAELAYHCAEIAIGMIEKTPWIYLSDKQPSIVQSRPPDFLVSKALLVKTKDGKTYEAKAYKFDNDSIDFFTRKGLHHLNNVVEWMEKPNNYSK